jgi:hypothetical protein
VRDFFNTVLAVDHRSSGLLFFCNVTATMKMADRNHIHLPVKQDESAGTQGSGEGDRELSED